jgi:exonuclease SbcD
VMIFDPETDLARLKEEYPEPSDDLVNLHVRYAAGKDSLEGTLKELATIFPRWYARDWTEQSALGPSLAPAEADRSKSFAETVREYLGSELQNHGDEERAALLALAEELIADAP